MYSQLPIVILHHFNTVDIMQRMVWSLRMIILKRKQAQCIIQCYPSIKKTTRNTGCENKYPNEPGIFPPNKILQQDLLLQMQLLFCGEPTYTIGISSGCTTLL